MKINAKVVMWSFVAVPFVVAFVLFGVAERKVQAKYEIGPVAWGEMNLVIGGGEGGCEYKSTACDGASDNIACDKGNTVAVGTVERTVYAGNKPQRPVSPSTPEPNTLLAPGTTTNVTCFVPYTCSKGTYQPSKSCWKDSESSNGAGCGNSGGSLGCTPLTCTKGTPGPAAKGVCVDP